MDAAEFIDRLTALEADEIVAVAAHIRWGHGTPEGEVAWWKAAIAVDATLRRHHLIRRAGLAAHEAAQAVLRSAHHAGADETSRDDVTAVARAASDTARAIVAERQGMLTPEALAPLYSPWQPAPAAA